MNNLNTLIRNLLYRHLACSYTGKMPVQQHNSSYTFTLGLFLLLLCTACKEDDPVAEKVPETITTTRLTFTPAGGGTPLTFEANDPDGDGTRTKNGGGHCA